MIYQLVVIKGYWLVKVDNNLFLLDTGLPFNISFDNNINNIKINNTILNLRYHPSSKLDILKEFDGNDVVGMIGFNSLIKLGVIEIDKKNMTITFGQSNKPITNHQISFNSFKFDVNVNGNIVSGYFDTGAHYTMVFDHDLLNNMENLGPYSEFSFTGWLHTNLYEGSLEFCGKRANNAYYLKSTPNTNSAGTKVVFGIDSLVDEYIVFDFNNNLLYFE